MSKQRLIGIIYGLFTLLILYYVDHQLQPGYWIKGGLKLTLFGLVPLWFLYRNALHLKQLLDFKRVKASFFGLCLGIIFVILIGYYILTQFTSFTNIPELLNQQTQVNLNNYLWVSLYIILINALLEEFFFRYLLIRLFKMDKLWLTHFISALLFALYHVAIISQWFQVWLFVLIVIGLTGVGLFFSTLNIGKNGITHSYLIHSSANIGINLVGLILMLQL